MIMNIEKSKVDKYLREYEHYLFEEEKSKNTIVKYIKDVRFFLAFINEKEIDKKIVLEFKNELIKKYVPNSINSMIAAVNHFLEWLGQGMYKVKLLKIQKDIFIKPEKELTIKEYERLVKCAKERGDERLALLIQTVCGTGIRISELQYITVEAVTVGRSQVYSKGKNRTVLLAKELCRALKKYCKEKGILSGAIFITKTGQLMNRSNVWKMMKALCKEAKVVESKVFPHNLRHLFAKVYYKVNKDISRLADLLGHVSINTTRIYTMESGNNHLKQLDKMRLVIECP